MEYIKARVEKLRKDLNDKKIDAVILSKKENCQYISGFTGSDSVVVISGNGLYLVIDSRYTEQAQEECGLFKVIEYKGDIYEYINPIIIDSNIKTMGFEDNYVTWQKHKELKKKLECKKLMPLKKTIEKLRIVKDDYELERIKKAASIVDDAFAYVLKLLKPGVRENEIAAELEHHMKKQGASKPSFDTIVASGIRSSLPHGIASEKIIENGDTVTIDFGAVYDGYCSDMTRTVFVGEPDPKMKEVYNIVLSAQKKALEGAASGKTGKEIDEIARETIKQAGYGDNFGHGLGHGVGLKIHEEPRLSPLGDTKMKDGMAVTVEPGIYISKFGGVRIEDLIVIRGGKPEVLSHSPKEMIVL